MLTVLSQAELAELIALWTEKPDAFGEAAFGLDYAPHQVDILRAVAANTLVSVSSGHKIGKGVVGATLAWWWVIINLPEPQAKSVVFLPTAKQAQDSAYAEIVGLYDRAVARGFNLGVRDEPSTAATRGITLRWGQRIFCLSTEGVKPESKAGFSGPVFYWIDEATGIPDSIFRVAEANPGKRIYTSSNPTRPGGAFYETQTKLTDVWRAFQINCENVARNNPPTPNGSFKWPYMATEPYIADMKRSLAGKPMDYGIRVKGEFPKLSSEGLITAEVVTAAQSRWTEQPGPADACMPLRIGIDCAHFGDDLTVFVARRGQWASRPWPCPEKTDSVDAAQLAKQFLFQHLREGETDAVFNIDTTSNGGCADNLAHDPEVTAVASINRLGFAGDPLNDPSGIQCQRIRDRLWVNCEDWLRTGGAIPPDERTLAEDLVEPKQRFNPHGRLEVESKKEVKKRLGRSPDRGDALCLAAFEPPAPRKRRTRVIT